MESEEIPWWGGLEGPVTQKKKEDPSFLQCGGSGPHIPHLCGIRNQE